MRVFETKDQRHIRHKRHGFYRNAENAEAVIRRHVGTAQRNSQMKGSLKVLITSAGDWLLKCTHHAWLDLGARDAICQKTAQRCKESRCAKSSSFPAMRGGFHTHERPVHSMILPAVIGKGLLMKTLVVGTGGFCDSETLAAALAMGADLASKWEPGSWQRQKRVILPLFGNKPLWTPAIRGTLIRPWFCGSCPLDQKNVVA